MTDKTDLIREIHEYVTTHGGENTATHLLVQAASAIQTQAAELEAVGAGVVQAHSAAPAIGDELRDTLVAVSAAIAEQDDRTAQKMIREILEASPTPPAEQATTTEAATPKAGVTTGAALGGVYAELPQPDSWFHFTPQYWGNKLRDFADRTHALRMEQAAPKAAPESFLDGADVQDESGVFAYYSREAVLACITAALESVAAPKAAPVVGDELRDTLVAVSAAIAEQDDRAAQKMIGEILAASPTPPAEQQAAYKAVPGEPLTRDQIREVFMAHGFTVKEGQTDLKQYVYDAAHALLELVAAPHQEPRFDCWSTNEGDSWFDHPADSQAIYDCLGNDAKVGDEYELTAGWKSVTARYRITEVVGDGEEYEVECISHPRENTAPQQEAQEPALFVSPKQLAALTDPDDPEGKHGRYLPARKTSKGLFTQPLYTAPQPAPDCHHRPPCAECASLTAQKRQP